MKVTLHRKAYFNAAHRLYNSKWTDHKNYAVFGKCSNPYYHGHNYELVVSVTGEVNPDTGFVIDVKILKDIIEKEVVVFFDHKNLNEQILEFKSLNPTAENISIVIWKRIRSHICSSLDLKVTLYETSNNFVTFEG